MIEFLQRKIYKQFKFPENRDDVAQTIINYSFINYVLKFCGLHIYSENFSRLNPVLLLALFDLVTYIMINSYTMMLYWGDLLKVSFCLVTLGCGFQAAIKAYTCLSKTQAIKNMQRNSLEIVKNPDNDDVKNIQLMYMRWYFIFSRIFSYMAFCAGVFILLQPSLEAVIKDQRILPYGFILPFVEPYGNPGYYLNWAHHALQTYLTISVLLGTLLINVHLLFHVYMQIETLVIMLERLNLMCKEAAVSRDASKVRSVSDYLKKIIKIHQKSSTFVNEFNDIFSLHALVNTMSLVFQITITMVTVVSYTTWLIGYVILLFAFLQLFFECFIGTVLYKYNDLLTNKIYDISWDTMEISDQKHLALLLQISEKPIMLSFKFGSVDLRLFVSVMKSVYSIFMALSNFK